MSNILGIFLFIFFILMYKGSLGTTKGAVPFGADSPSWRRKPKHQNLWSQHTGHHFYARPWRRSMRLWQSNQPSAFSAQSLVPFGDFFSIYFLFDRLVSIGWVQVALYDPHALPEIGLKTVPFAPLNLLPKPVSRLPEIAEKVTKIEKIEK